MLPKYIDIHSHLNDKQFDKDRQEVINRTLQGNVWTITIGTDKEMSQKACELSILHNGLYASVGMHPSDNKQEKFDAQFYRNLVKKYPKVVAIGECGLDYFHVPEGDIEEKRRQKDIFERHIELAVEMEKPLMIHCRDAYSELLDILKVKKREYGDGLTANIHFFAGDVETAQKCFDLDFTISFTGVLTFARNYDEVVKYAPLERIMAETDAPYVAPVPYRGKRNEPLYVSEVVKKIALIRGEDEKMVSDTLIKNTIRAFKGLAIDPKSSSLTF